MKKFPIKVYVFVSFWNLLSVKQALGFLVKGAHIASKTNSGFHEPIYNLPFIVNEGALLINYFIWRGGIP